MFQFKSIQTQILFSFLILLISVLCFLFYFLLQSNLEEKSERAEFHLDTASEVFHNQMQVRETTLFAFAQTVAKDFGLKQALNEDRRSFLVALNNHRLRIEADLAMALTPQGETIGTLTLDPISLKVRADQDSVSLAQTASEQADRRTSQFLKKEQGIYQLKLVPVKSGQTVIAWIGFGFALDTRLSQHLAKLTGMEVELYLTILSDETIQTESVEQAESRLIATSTPTRQQLVGKVPPNFDPKNYITSIQQIGLIENGILQAKMFQDRDDLLGTLQKRWQLVIIALAIIFTVAILFTFLLAKNLARPLQAFTEKAKQIAQGDEGSELVVNRDDELGTLAVEFNAMNKAIAERQSALNFLAYHNDLTKLANKKMLFEDIAKLMLESSSKFMLIRFRLLEFEELNYSLGNDTGDELQIAATKRLAKIDKQANFYQLGAAEFAMLSPIEVQHDQSVLLANIANGVEGVFRLKRISVSVHSVSGFCRYPDHGHTARELLHNAGIALQYAYVQRSPIVEFATTMADNALSRVTLTHDLFEAIQTGQLVLFYQPKLNLTSHKVDKAEALVRWFHPEKGMIPPDEFIGIAEATGQIDALTDWVLSEAMKQASLWLEQGIELCVAVNISAINLKQEGFDHKVLNLLKQHGLNVESITLEVTESALADDPEHALNALRSLSDHGLEISIDDYGTGYSSLSQLKHLPATELKVDKAFILNVASDTQDQTIAKSTITLAHEFGLRTVAEGVEDQASLEWLEQQGCEYAQGYFISRPLPEKDFTPWLTNWNKASDNPLIQSG